MAKLYGKEYSKSDLLKRVGSLSQIAGVRSITLQDGNEAGVRAVEFRTGSGFDFTVLADRGLDVSSCHYQGQSLAWRSSSGDTAPQFYEPIGLGWLRSFPGGLITTCGLTNVGTPNEDNGEQLGAHGRYSNLPAKNVYMDGEWQGDDYVMWAQGKVNETRIFAENLQVTRRIWTKLGEKRFWLSDVVENLGFVEWPFEILYHINGGFPVIDAGAELLSPTTGTARPRDADAEIEADQYNKFVGPTHGFKERCYYHEMAVDADGAVYAALVNKSFNNGQGFGFYAKYLKSQLPIFTEWKMNCEGTYVVGMEPANCHVEGRTREREYGTLQTIKPGEKKNIDIEIGVLTSQEEIAAIEEKIARAKAR